MTISDDLEKTEKERMDLLYEQIKSHVAAGTIDSAHKELLAEAERLEIKSKAPLVLAELLFDLSIAIQVIQSFYISSTLCQRHESLALSYFLKFFYIAIVNNS